MICDMDIQPLDFSLFSAYQLAFIFVFVNFVLHPRLSHYVMRLISTKLRGFCLSRPSLRVASFSQSLGKTLIVSSALSENDLAALLEQPSWSVNSLLDVPSRATLQSAISQTQLHHLLRLSALPLPISDEEETKMKTTLTSQLHFVQAIQDVDTTGVQPLQCIRDETTQATVENEINLEVLKEELDKEEVIGPSRRIKGGKAMAVNTQSVQEPDLLAQAPKKVGRYILVDTRNQ